LREKLEGSDLLQIDRVIDDIRTSVGETVSKSNAAEMLEVSRQTVDTWIQKGLIPAVKSQSGREKIPRQSLERVLHEVRREGPASLKRAKESRVKLADLLRSLAEEIEGDKDSRKSKKQKTAKPAAAKPAAKPKAGSTSAGAAGDKKAKSV
jgi:excisionase family DNA binding protein